MKYGSWITNNLNFSNIFILYIYFNSYTKEETILSIHTFMAMFWSHNTTLCHFSQYSYWDFKIITYSRTNKCFVSNLSIFDKFWYIFRIMLSICIHLNCHIIIIFICIFVTCLNCSTYP